MDGQDLICDLHDGTQYESILSKRWSSHNVLIILKDLATRLVSTYEVAMILRLYMVYSLCGLAAKPHFDLLDKYSGILGSSSTYGYGVTSTHHSSSLLCMQITSWNHIRVRLTMATKSEENEIETKVGNKADERGSGDISAPEISEDDVLLGAKAVNPDVTIEQLISLANDPEILEKIKSAKEFKFIIIGKTGTGKSTLINGLIGAEVAMVEDDLTTEGVTQEVESYTRKINDIEVVAYDSPGLEDGSGKEEEYLEEIYRTCQQGMGLVIFAISMTGKRFTPGNPDTRALVKFTERLKPAIWEKTLVTLTQANLCEALNPRLRSKSKQDKKEFFKKMVGDYKAVIHQTLTSTGVPAAIVEKVKVVPVGIEYEPELLDGTLWFSNFWFECLTTIPSADGRTAMTQVNYRRLKSLKDVTAEDFRQPLYNQPIVMNKTKRIAVTVGTAAAFTAIGAAVGGLGFLGGPVGIVTTPIGIAVGLFLGIVVSSQIR